MSASPKIELLEEKIAEWYDRRTRRIMKGRVYAYLYSHKGINWLINVRIAEDREHAIVELVSSSEAGIIPWQLTRKSLIFQRSKIRGYLYIPVSVACFDKLERRVHYVRISKIDQLPTDMIRLFRLMLYEEVAPPELIHRYNPYRGKITALVKDDDHEKMALFYVYTRILPLEGWLV